MYRSSRNRFKLDKRGDDEQTNNNRFKWGSNSSTPQVKPLLPVKKALRKQNEKVVYCTYYNRDGYCRNGSGCRFVHDKSRVRTCPEFIKSGKCKIPKCYLRHRPDPHTMASWYIT